LVDTELLRSRGDLVAIVAGIEPDRAEVHLRALAAGIAGLDMAVADRAQGFDLAPRAAAAVVPHAAHHVGIDLAGDAPLRSGADVAPGSLVAADRFAAGACNAVAGKGTGAVGGRAAVYGAS